MLQYPEEFKLFSHLDTLHAFYHEERVYPAILEVQPTMICDFNCEYCYTRVGSKASLDEDQLLQLAKALFVGKTKAVVLSGGGEPLINKAVPKFNISCPVPVGLITNGASLDKLTSKEIDVFEWISVSLHGLSRTEFKKTTHVDKFEKVVANLKLLKRGSVSYFMADDVEYDYGLISQFVRGLLQDVPESIVFRFKGSQRHIRAMQVWFDGYKRVITSTTSFMNTEEVNQGEREIYDFCVGKYLIPVLGSDGRMYCSCSGTPLGTGTMTSTFDESLDMIKNGFPKNQGCIDLELQKECYPYRYNKVLIEKASDIWI